MQLECILNLKSKRRFFLKRSLVFFISTLLFAPLLWPSNTPLDAEGDAANDYEELVESSVQEDVEFVLNEARAGLSMAEDYYRKMGLKFEQSFEDFLALNINSYTNVVRDEEIREYSKTLTQLGYPGEAIFKKQKLYEKLSLEINRALKGPSKEFNTLSLKKYKLSAAEEKFILNKSLGDFFIETDFNTLSERGLIEFSQKVEIMEAELIKTIKSHLKPLDGVSVNKAEQTILHLAQYEISLGLLYNSVDKMNIQIVNNQKAREFFLKQFAAFSQNSMRLPNLSEDSIYTQSCSELSSISARIIADSYASDVHQLVNKNALFLFLVDLVKASGLNANAPMPEACTGDEENKTLLMEMADAFRDELTQNEWLDFATKALGNEKLETKGGMPPPTQDFLDLAASCQLREALRPFIANFKAHKQNQNYWSRFENSSCVTDVKITWVNGGYELKLLLVAKSSTASRNSVKKTRRFKSLDELASLTGITF